jgi:predicted transcriptional regulator of viral defense system
VKSILDGAQLRNRIGREEFDYVLLKSVLSDYSRPDQKISELLKSGVIIRVKKGLYVFGEDYRHSFFHPEIFANLIYGPSCISLEYALGFHGLIPERVYMVTSVTPKKNKSFRTPIGEFSYQHLSMERYPHGIEQVWLDNTHPVLMASPEKALCDYQVHHKIEYVTDSKSALEFLEDDLRIDEWKRLDREALSKLNKFYRSEVIQYVLELL